MWISGIELWSIRIEVRTHLGFPVLRIHTKFRKRSLARDYLQGRWGLLRERLWSAFGGLPEQLLTWVWLLLLLLPLTWGILSCSRYAVIIWIVESTIICTNALTRVNLIDIAVQSGSVVCISKSDNMLVSSVVIRRTLNDKDAITACLFR
jgi:hypothetical protein